MKATVREFTRRFPVFRRAALAGEAVEVRDREGNSFLFRAVKGHSESLAEAMGNLLGCVHSGQAKKTLAGYGRD